MSPFICDGCRDEVSYSEKVIILASKQEIVLCKKCLKKQRLKEVSL